MKKLLSVIAASAFVVGTASAVEPLCTLIEQEAWMSEEDFKDKASEMGYEVNSLKVTDGNCYTLTKLNASSEEEIEYFDPVTGEKFVE